MGYISDTIEEEDITFCVGNRIINEEILSEKHKVFYVKDEDFDVFSFSLGMSVFNKHRVLVIVEDKYLLKHLSSLAQVAVSNSSNYVIIVLNTNIYSDNINFKTLNTYLRSTFNTVFNMGIKTLNYNNYFSNKKEFSKMLEFYKKPFGPMAIFLDISNKKLHGELDRHKNLPDITDIIKKDGLYNTKE
jgi:hypothetical protein